LPQLSIDFAVGSPGSSFTITGSAFPPATGATIEVNGLNIGHVMIDSIGRFRLFLDTSPEAAPGLYEVKVIAEAGTGSLQSGSQSAHLAYSLRADSITRVHQPDLTTPTLAVPASIPPHDDGNLYLPLVASHP